MDDAIELFRIGNDDLVLFKAVREGKIHMLSVQLQFQLFRAVPEKFLRADLGKCIRHAVGVDLGVEGELVDQPVHLICLVVNGLDVALHLFGRIGDPVHDAFDVAFYGRDRRLQIMGNVADQLPVLAVVGQLFVLGFLKPFPHFLKNVAELVHFLRASGRFQRKIIITVTNASGRFF